MSALGALSGGLALRVLWRGGRIERVRVSSRRPLQVTRLLEGGSLAQAVQRVPLLFSLCGAAQTVAALRACEQAAAIAVPPAVEQARNWLVLGETARELGGRVWRDWSGSRESGSRKSGSRERAPEVALGRWYAELQSALAPALALGATTPGALQRAQRSVETLAELLRQLLAEVARLGVLERIETAFGDIVLGPGVPPLEPFAGDWLEAQLAGAGAADFCRAPHWHGAARETGPYARQAAPSEAASIAARLQAVLGTLQRLPEYWRATGAEVVHYQSRPQGVGYGIVEAARGRLLHRVALEGERVAAYHIVAPTEWNFHTEGVIPRSLEGVAVERARAAALVRALVLALDPCVGFAIEFIGEAEQHA